MLSKKDWAAAKKYARETPKEDQAFGWVTDGKFFPGTFRFMPILAWVADPPPPVESPDPMTLAMREKSGGKFGITTRKLILSGALLRMVEGSFVGTLDWSIPMTEMMEPTIHDLLATFGWDGRVWPADAGWPDDSQEERIGMKELMLKKRLESTLTFPPGENGNPVMTVQVLKVARPFPLPPTLIEERVTASPELRLRFKSLTGGDFHFPS